MYALLDTFNDKIISRHKTVEAAAIAKNKKLDAIKKKNGQSSYIPMVCMKVVGDELARLTDDEQDDFLAAEASE
jgi:hypothetical protein